MKHLTNIIVLMIFCIVTNMGQRTFLDNFTGTGRLLRGILNNIYDKESRTHFYNWQIQASHKLQDVVDKSTPFPCSVKDGRSKHKPTSVNMLRPGDIDVIGALGDSLTAGLGALSTNPFNLFREYRGLSFAIGGQKTWREYLTLPNILKEYNPNLVGYSLAPSASTDRRSQFNVAEAGAMASDLYYMAKVLITRIKHDKRVNITSDWKFISICMGANDFCAEICYHKEPHVALEKYRSILIKTLRVLRDNLPRTFVNFISAPNVFLLKHMTNLPPQCEISHRLSCPCLIGEAFKSFVPIVGDVIRQWKEIDANVSMYEEFNREDFTIELQPTFQELVLPRTPNGAVDYTAFAPDCFHFSQKGHAIVSLSLWNNLLSCIKRKQTTIVSESMKCPVADKPYLATKNNMPLC